VLSPYVRPDAQGLPQYALPGSPQQPLPYLAYAPGAYLGRAVDQMLKQSSTPVHLDRIYETDMAEGLKAMALEGHGIAFLPASAVRKEVRARKLVSAGGSLETALDIRIYRERSSTRRAKGPVEQFWNDLRKKLESP
jgi:LysR family transcriptional regulator, hypochlorite-specific transcription factor HypT